MKRFLIFIALFMATTFAINAQTVDFRLSAGGNMTAKDGNSFIVVPFNGKTASALFQQLFTNAGSVFKSSTNKVIININGSSIGIRAYDNKLSYNLVNKQQEWLGGYYNLSFEVKDGKVKVNAPTVDETMTDANGVRQKDFSKMVISFFTDGSLQAKYQQQATYTEQQLNNYVNAILTGVMINNSEADW